MNFSSINNIIREAFRFQEGMNYPTRPNGYQHNQFNQMNQGKNYNNQQFTNYNQYNPNYQPIGYLTPMNINNVSRMGLHNTNLYYMDKVKNFLFKEI